MKKFLILLFVSISSFFLGQSGQKKNANFTVRGNIGIAKPISSNQFRTAFNGLYEANVSTNFRLFSNFYAGLGYQNTLFKNNDLFKFIYFNASLPYNTRLSGNSGFLKLGYDQFKSETIYLSYAANVGYMLAGYINVNLDSSLSNQPFVSKNFQAPYIQPEFSVNFIVEKSLSFSLMCSYTSLFYRFDPKGPRFNHIGDIQKVSNKYLMSWFTFGFGFTVLIGNTK